MSITLQRESFWIVRNIHDRKRILKNCYSRREQTIPNPKPDLNDLHTRLKYDENSRRKLRPILWIRTNPRVRNCRKISLSLENGPRMVSLKIVGHLTSISRDEVARMNTLCCWPRWLATRRKAKPSTTWPVEVANNGLHRRCGGRQRYRFNCE